MPTTLFQVPNGGNLHEAGAGRSFVFRFEDRGSYVDSRTGLWSAFGKDTVLTKVLTKHGGLHNGSKLCPPPSHDSPQLRDLWQDIDKRAPYAFGFDSLSDLRLWFSGCKAAIAELIATQASHLVTIAVYEVDNDDVVRGSRQLMFRGRNIKRPVATLSLAQVF